MDSGARNAAPLWLTGVDPDDDSYVPLEVLARRLGRPAHAIVRLDGDENPYGPSLRVLEVLGAAESLHRPPDPEARDCRAALEPHTGVPRERITVGAGLTELLARILRLVAPAGTTVVVTPPTRAVYATLAAATGHEVVAVPRLPDFSLDLPRLEEVLARTEIGALIAGSPNDPTGTATPPNDIVRLLHQGTPVIVDESYVEYAERSGAPLTGEFPNLIIVRDCGPWAGLGGLPIGYTITDRALADRLRAAGRLTAPNQAAQLALLASLDDREALLSRVRQLCYERGRLFRQLRKLNLVDPILGEAPFLLCAVRRSSAGRIAGLLADDGIVIRPYSTPPLANHLRIAAGRPDDTDRVYQALLRLAERVVI